MLLTSMTQRDYCGRWSDDDLVRTRALLIRQMAELRAQLDRLTQELVFITSEQMGRA